MSVFYELTESSCAGVLCLEDLHSALGDDYALLLLLLSFHASLDWGFTIVAAGSNHFAHEAEQVA